jgi:ANTAR domain/GAF domain
MLLPRPSAVISSGKGCGMQDAGAGSNPDRTTGWPGQLARVRALLAEEPPAAGDPASIAVSLQRLCRAAARALPASGVAVSLMTQEGSSEVAAASNRTSELIEELQFTFGEGPCIDASATGRPVLASTIADQSMSRWPGYSPAVHSLGVRAVFAFPLQIGAVRLGSLDVYREWAGALSVEALSQALTFAEVATMIVLDGQEEAVRGESAAGLEDALESHFEVHQAQGMVMIQLGVDVAEAMVRLRAYAYSTERGLGDVARDILARTLTLERDR